ncbi:hypothetical protein C0J52_07973 [Blattella germanica]|nr:hypothetical protein C0J52_07973 [Blattella germanica]
MRMAYHLCQCIPFFYRRIEGLPVCNVRGMRCLGYHKDTLISLSLPGHPHICNCLPVCDDVTFFLENMKSYEGLFNKGLNLQWRMENFPRMRVKRDMIFGFADLWVSIGGTGGLFLGCSVLSVIEIIYFFTLRLIIYVWNVKRKSSSKSKSFTKIG